MAQLIQNLKSMNKAIIPKELVIPLKIKFNTFINLSGKLGSEKGIKFITPDIRLNKASSITNLHLQTQICHTTFAAYWHTK